MPHIHPTAFVHAAAHVIGDVTLGARASVWPTAVLRGDSDAIVVGEDSNIQDGCVIHVIWRAVHHRSASDRRASRDRAWRDRRR